MKEKRNKVKKKILRPFLKCVMVCENNEKCPFGQKVKSFNYL